MPLATHNRSPRPPAEEARRTGSEELPLTTHNRSPRPPAGKHAKQAVKSCRSRRTTGHQERRKGSTPNGQRRIAARPAQQIIKIDGRGTSAEQTAKSYRSPHTHNRSPRSPAGKERQAGGEELPLATHNGSSRSPAGKHAERAAKNCRSPRTTDHQDRWQGKGAE